MNTNNNTNKHKGVWLKLWPEVGGFLLSKDFAISFSSKVIIENKKKGLMQLFIQT